MPDGDAAAKELPPELKSALEALNTLFAGSLWDAKANSSHAAWADIRVAKSGKQKFEIINRQFQNWKDACVAAVREWLPKYIALAQTLPRLSDGDPLRWTEQRVWDVLEAQCGARSLTDRRPGSVTPTMIWWFAGATDGNSSINDRFTAAKPWMAPRWLTRNCRETDRLLRQCSHALSVRFYGVVNEELLKAQVSAQIAPQRSETKLESIALHPPTKRKRGLLRRYRSLVKRAIANALVKNPGATDQEVCSLIDADGTAELDGEDRTFLRAYKDPKRRPRLETTISKVRRDMRDDGLF